MIIYIYIYDYHGFKIFQVILCPFLCAKWYASCESLVLWALALRSLCLRQMFMPGTCPIKQCICGSYCSCNSLGGFFKRGQLVIILILGMLWSSLPLLQNSNRTIRRTVNSSVSSSTFPLPRLEMPNYARSQVMWLVWYSVMCVRWSKSSWIWPAVPDSSDSCECCALLGPMLRHVQSPGTALHYSAHDGNAEVSHAHRAGWILHTVNFSSNFLWTTMDGEICNWVSFCHLRVLGLRTRSRSFAYNCWLTTVHCFFGCPSKSLGAQTRGRLDLWGSKMI